MSDNNYLRVPAGEPVPLSHLELDLPAPAQGWAAYLAEMGIQLQVDDIGRLSLARVDAKQLFAERAAAEQKAREVAAENERAAIEKDRQFRAALNPGIPWWHFDGASYGQAVAAVEAAQQPQRVPTAGEWLFNQTDTMVFHSLEGQEDEA
jgi:hypothetical protein